MSTAVQRPPTAQTERARMEADVERWSADHLATIAQADGNVIDFRRPGTSVYAIRFRIDGGYLIVTGDVGEGIYQWSQQLTWEFLAGCDFGYFRGKCQASPQGRRPRGWSAEVAEAELRRVVTEDREAYGIPERTTWDRLSGADDDWWEWDEPDLGCPDMWLDWLHQYGHDAFGADFYEWAPRIGEVPDIQQLAHWKMLRMAVGQLAEDGAP